VALIAGILGRYGGPSRGLASSSGAIVNMLRAMGKGGSVRSWYRASLTRRYFHGAHTPSWRTL